VILLLLWTDGIPRRDWLRLLAPAVATTIAVFLYRWSVLRGIGGYEISGGNPLFFSVNPVQTGKALLLRLPAVFVFPINWTHQPEWWLTVSMTFALVAFGAVASARARARELGFALGFVVVTALPAHPFLLVGLDLEKSRVLYLPSAGFALLVAVAVASLDARKAVAAGCAIVIFQVAALEHNLMIWRSTANQVENTCGRMAQVADAFPEPLVISDIPRTIDGVYFLQNGLHSCVEWAAGKPLPQLAIQGEPIVKQIQRGRSLRWNVDARNFRVEQFERK